VEHNIVTTPGPAVHSKPRRPALDNLKWVKAEFERMMEQGVIRPSKCPRASPMHIVSRKDRGLRPCGDYRTLNAGTIPYRYSLPHTEDFT
jgi:hypothetical protein